MAPVCNAKGGLVDALVETSLEKTNLEDEQKPAQVVSARKSMTFERLPSEILLKIVSKLPFRADGGLTDFDNLKKACHRVKALFKENECWLAKIICAEWFPLQTLAMSIFLAQDLHFNMIVCPKFYARQVEDVLSVAEERMRNTLPGGQPASPIGCTSRTEGWQRIVILGMTFFQLNAVTASGTAYGEWDQACDTLPAYVCLVLRYTALFIHDLYLSNPNRELYGPFRIGGCLLSSKACAKILEWSLWTPIALNFQYVVGTVTKFRPGDREALLVQFHAFAEDTARGSGASIEISVAVLVGMIKTKTWEHLKKAYGVQMPAIDLFKDGKMEMEAEVTVLRRILDQELQSRTLAEVSGDMMRFG